ncbi:unnamed protein product [Trifolium pratense]|uniref:Uncharacterized protein n=1 Tax=Trifolium pratense TaxID=57577 RepID=A0ACB0M7C5_TRIPR|nr:unnamed protein product [Trifolium pratense]
MRVRYRTYYLECNVNHGAVKLPKMFADDFGDEIGRIANLVDAKDNHLEVLVDKIDDDVYFTRGWASVKNFYDIRTGAWVVLIYSGFGQFGISIHDRLQCPVIVLTVRYITGMEITYPFKTPPYKLMLEKPFQEATSSGHIPYFVLPKVFSHRLEKTLTTPDIQTGTLTLYWRGFCQNALPNEETQLRIIDWLGNTWNQCDLGFDNTPYMSCKISGD